MDFPSALSLALLQGQGVYLGPGVRGKASVDKLSMGSSYPLPTPGVLPQRLRCSTPQLRDLRDARVLQAVSEHAFRDAELLREVPRAELRASVRSDGRPGHEQARSVCSYAVLDGRRLVLVVATGEVDELVGEGAPGFDSREVLVQPDAPAIGIAAEVPQGEADDLDTALVCDCPRVEHAFECSCGRGHT